MGRLVVGLVSWSIFVSWFTDSFIGWSSGYLTL